MAKTNITQYSATPSSNTDINSINIDENCPASGLNNAIRELMAHLKNVDTGSQALTALSVTGDTTISSGNLLVGGTDTDPYDNTSEVGIALRSTGAIYNAIDGGTPLVLNRMTNDGAIAQFRQGGSIIGNIDSRGGVALTINSQGGNGRLGQGGTAYYEWNTTRFAPITDTVGDLGRGVNRWKDLYLSGGVYLGGTGSANFLDDYEEGGFTPTIGGTATYSRQIGHYTKVGDLCFIHVDVIISTMGTGSVTDLSGLPFTSLDVTGASGHISMSFYQNLNTPTIWVGGYVNNNTDTIYFNGNSSSVQSIGLNRFNVFQNGTRVLFSGVYKVA